MSLQLRPRQVDSINALRESFKRGNRVVMLYGSTGFGKTELAISLMKAVADKGNRAAMVLDRIVLCNQTSARLQKYDIEHGVLQSGHWRWRPEEKIQVCSAQTLEKRGSFPEAHLLIIDEAHVMRADTTELIKNNPHIRVVGLSASPFTKGLGAVYEDVVSACTTKELVDEGWLTGLRVFISHQIDMEGAKKIAGEWSPKETTERGIKITGDIVSEWVKKTHEIYGAPRKTIVFCAGVAHGEDLSRKFAEAGYNFVSVSYKDDDEFKTQAIAEFSKPDSTIHGLIATDLLTKGFDVSDAMIGISARPFSKSFSSHVQQMGRVMRQHEGKEFAVWLDFSGNYLRFKDQWDDLYSNGVTELDDGAEKTKPEPSTKDKEAAKCPRCGALWPSHSETCAHCGMVRVRRNEVVAVPGAMSELNGSEKSEKYSMEYKTDFYAQALGYANSKGHQAGSAYFRYKEKFGVGPSMKKPEPVAPTQEFKNWIVSRAIAKSKGRK